MSAARLLTLPGGTDVHVHGRDPGFRDKEDFGSLTAAARAGGITTVFDMPNTVPATDTAELLWAKAALVSPKAVVNYGLWGLIRSTTKLETVHRIAEAGAVGFKAYLGYAFRKRTRTVTYAPGTADADQEPPPSYRTLDRLGPTLAQIGLPLAVHAEDADMLRAAARPVASYDDLLASRPAEAEATAIQRCAEIARRHGFRLHVVHVASAAGVAAVRAARAAGTRITAETCPQYLFLCDQDFERVGTFMKMFPVIRTAADRDAVREALAAGEIDMLATDHAPHTTEEKSRPLAEAHAGSPGVQWLYVAALEFARECGDPRLAARWVAEAPAAAFGFRPNGEVTIDTEAETVVGEGALSRQPRGALDGLRFGFRVAGVNAPERGTWVHPLHRLR